jgi:hypothetical protein
MYTILCHEAVNEGWFEGMLLFGRIYVRTRSSGKN